MTMRPKRAATIGFLLAGTVAFLPGCFHAAKQQPSVVTVQPDVREAAIGLARQVYQAKKAEGVDFSSGPCLTDALLEGWVVDVAHNPRQDIDDLPENQCANFRNGTAKHFVELDTEGNLIRAQ